MPKDFDVQGSVANVWGARTRREPATEERPPRFDRDRYARGGLLGEGGMGRVFIARDLLLDRDVALKECRPELGAPGRERLAHEARITARLEHPNILPIYDAGDDDEGTSWFVTRLVRGQPLGSRLRGVPLAERLDALRPVLAATEAVAFAHSRGVVHRDLKPDNILVGAFGETLVADWGLAAELVDGQAVDAGRVGTAGYMAPEQASGAPATPASDVFALGVVLFELATGADVASGDPGPGSASGAARLHASGAPGELVGVVTKASAPDPAERYPTAKELAADLDALLAGRRVSAHDYSAAELLGRLVRLWRAPLAVAAVAGLLLAGAIAVGFARTEAQRQRAERESQRAQEEAARAEAEARRGAESAAEALLEQARTALGAGDLDDAEALARRALEFAPGQPGARGLLAAQALRERARRDVVPVDAADCEFARLLSVGVACARGDVVSLRTPEGTLWEQPAPVLEGLETAGASLFVRGLPLREVDPRSGADVAVWRAEDTLHEVARSSAVTLAWAGPTLARLGAPPTELGWCAGSDVADVALGTEQALIMCGDMTYGLVDPRDAAVRVGRVLQPYVGDGVEVIVHLGDDRFALMGSQGNVAVLHAPSGVVESYHPVTDGVLVQAAVTDGGRLLAVRTARGAVYLVDLALGARERLPTAGARDLRFLDDGRLEVLTTTVERWRLPEEGTGWIIRAGGVSSLAAHPSSGDVAAALGDGSVLVWRPGEPTRSTRLFGGVVKNAVWQGEQILAGASVLTAPAIGWLDAEARLVRTAGRTPYRRVAAVDGWGPIALRYVGEDPILALDEGASPPAFGDRVYVDLVAVGSRFALEDAEGKVTLAAWRDGAVQVVWEEDADANGAIALSGRGLVAAGTSDGVLLLGEDPAAGQARRTLPFPARVTALAFSPRGERVAAGGLDGSLRVWRVEDGALLLEHTAHEGRLSGLAFRGDDELVTGGWDRTARRWDLSERVTGGPATGVPRPLPQGLAAED